MTRRRRRHSNGVSEQTTPFLWTPDEMLEVYLDHPDDFLKIIETLTRIGVVGAYNILDADADENLRRMHLDDHEMQKMTRLSAESNRINTLTQTCYLLHKKGRYYVVHFLEMFFLNGYKSSVTEADLEYRNTIAMLLSDWGMLEIAQQSNPLRCAKMSEIRVIRHQEKKDWVLISKCPIGNKNKKNRKYC